MTNGDSDISAERYYSEYSESGYTREAVYPVLNPLAETIRILLSECGIGGKVLDVGCARGFLVQMLQDRGLDACGVDLSPWALEQASEEVRDRLYLVDVENEALPFPGGSFSLVAAISVLEHVRSLENVLSEIHRCLVPGGLLFVNVPNPSLKEEAGKEGHVLMLTRRGWVRAIEARGFYHEQRLSRRATWIKTGAYARWLAGRRFQTSLPLVSWALHISHWLKRRLAPRSYDLVFQTQKAPGGSTLAS